jgi:hypothetical protein
MLNLSLLIESSFSIICSFHGAVLFLGFCGPCVALIASALDVKEVAILRILVLRECRCVLKKRKVMQAKAARTGNE